MNAIVLICLSIMGIAAAFYYVAGAFINIGAAFYRVRGYVRFSAVPLVPSVTGTVAGLIASIYFGWLPVWLAVLLATLPDIVYILGCVILGLRIKRGFVPKDSNPSVPGREFEAHAS